MTIQEQVVFATDRVAHWNSKRDHALAMLTKWQARLSALQAKGAATDREEAAGGNACARYRTLDAASRSHDR